MNNQTNLVSILTHANLLGHGMAYIAMGLSGFFNPAAKLAHIGLLATTPAGQTTFRVIYGGLMLGIALVFVMSSLLPNAQRFGLLTLIAVMLSLITARTLGAVLDNSMDASQLLWSGIEFAVVLLSAYLYRAQPVSP